MKKLFYPLPFNIDGGLLILRVFAGSFLLYGHGWPKLANFSERSLTFSDPLGIGSEVSLALAIFAEVFCSILLILGLTTRLALVPLIFTMVTAAFIHLDGEPFGKRELALLFLVIFSSLIFTGPGRYSLDKALYDRIK